MASENFGYAYLITSGAPPGNVTLSNRDGGNYTLTEADSVIDGSVAVGDAVQVSGDYNFTGVFLGYAVDGSGNPAFPLIEAPWGAIHMFSDNGFLQYQTWATSTSYPYAVCFLEGTAIATQTGGTAVEELSIGDLILTATGKEVPIKWIGRQTVSKRFGPAERLMPVRFAAGSLGDGLPTADLTVTADHGMFIDGVICHAGALVNGTTITQVPLEEMGETYTVYHIETEEHEIILAYGAPAETFIDNVSRRAFDNFAEFDALYGDVPEMEELPYPRAMSARQVPAAIRARLAERAVA
ncbi:Hint domain-containing protein [Nioella sp.]|uniref:Hint domain-containing protein n=1 Tax=Nioella sp. TaxID=1912091 RepID=UPI003B522204